MNDYISNKTLNLSLLFLVLHSVPLFSQIDEILSLDQGIEFYEAEEYQEARGMFENLVQVNSENSNYYHWLGKSYGRIAESSSWLSAMSMAKKTKKAFEKAVELDSKNIEALRDLKQYYFNAPGFLGGSKKKAKEIDKRIDKLAN